MSGGALTPGSSAFIAAELVWFWLEAISNAELLGLTEDSWVILLVQTNVPQYKIVLTMPRK